MTLLLSIVIGSGLCLTLLVSLYWYEEKRGRRFGESVRNSFDRVVVMMVTWWNDFIGRSLYRSARVTGHYLIHAALNRFLHTVRWLEVHVLHLQRKNRQAVRAAQSSDPYLEAIREHKSTTALTSEQKRLLRSKKLG